MVVDSGNDFRPYTYCVASRTFSWTFMITLTKYTILWLSFVTRTLQCWIFWRAKTCFALNNGGDFHGTGGYGWTDELPSSGFDGSHVKTEDMWGFCESQETVGVSPEIFEEFIFPYQNEILQRFGLNIYGCCEPLDTRWDVVKKIPRLRKVTVSPWSNNETMAEHLSGDYVYCKKVNPALIAVSNVDEDAVRKELREVFNATKKHRCPTEVLMRDVMTLANKAENAVRWVQIAREEAER